MVPVRTQNIPPLPITSGYFPVIFASVVRLRHFGTCARKIVENWVYRGLKGLFFVSKRLEPVILLNLGHKLTFFTFLLVGTRRWNVETCLLTTCEDRPWTKVITGWLDCLTDWLFDWLTGWLILQLIVMTDWLMTDWLIDWDTDWQTDGLTEWLIKCLSPNFESFVIVLINWLIGRKRAWWTCWQMDNLTNGLTDNHVSQKERLKDRQAEQFRQTAWLAN